MTVPRVSISKRTLGQRVCIHEAWSYGQKVDCQRPWRVRILGFRLGLIGLESRVLLPGYLKRAPNGLASPCSRKSHPYQAEIVPPKTLQRLSCLRTSSTRVETNVQIKMKDCLKNADTRERTTGSRSADADNGDEQRACRNRQTFGPGAWLYI